MPGKHSSPEDLTCRSDGEDARVVQVTKGVASLAHHHSEPVLLEVKLMWAVTEGAYRAAGSVRRLFQLLPPLAGVDAPLELHLDKGREDMKRVGTEEGKRCTCVWQVRGC
ncbi:hypothetical protein E2C01_083268 [Portunus trituberculatus]|uniref:Uncharacterized protein n=1 Tax=Portunus trituberculatus TaxID=210409 RepID=A0A5B7J462_PORTR|nr:hypothetical protein [Portunus trituberculatus]